MIDSLASFGCEADLILFHPYDKGYWGFDSMPMEVNLRYLQYLQARLSSFHNVWWSLANEYDLVKQKSEDEWCQLIAAVKKNDPYRHLVSIHGSTATYFPYEREGLTHTSIQDEAPVIQQGRAGILWSIYKIPVVLDEVRYEGNLPYRWGRISGEEMINTMWNGILMGCYVTHGECYQYKAGDYDTIFGQKEAHGEVKVGNESDSCEISLQIYPIHWRPPILVETIKSVPPEMDITWCTSEQKLLLIGNLIYRKKMLLIPNYM